MPRKLDLRTGKSVWSAYRAPKVETGPLTRDIRTEVLIVGMGISAAMIAQALAGRGHDVVCIDRRGPLEGSTAATTALVQFEIDQPLSLLADSIGRLKAEAGWRRSRLAVSNLWARIRELEIDCDAHPRLSLFLDGDVLSPSALRDEGEGLCRAGIFSTYLKPAELQERFGIAGRSALLSYDNLALDPRKLAAGLFERAAARKARFFAPTEAVAVRTARTGVTVTTGTGHTIQAGQVILATGYELMDIVPAARHRIVSTFALATKPQPRAIWPEAAFLWEASDPYLYMRATSDGRIICGGEDEDSQDEDARDALIPEKIEAIRDKLGRIFPKIDTTPEFAWAGAFGTTATGLPFIGALPGEPRLFAVMGYGGNGITFSQIASEMAVSWLAGEKDADAALFTFDP